MSDSTLGELLNLDEEKLREAACYGDVYTLAELVRKGVDVNSANTVNGWCVTLCNSILKIFN
jgi:hypothetical protein